MALANGKSIKASSSSNAGLETSGTGMDTTSGSGIIIGVMWHGATFTSVVDNKGNSYLQLGTEQSLGSIPQLSRKYYCANVIGGTGHTFTLNLSTPTICTILVQEITTTNGAGLTLDQHAEGPDDLSSPFTGANVVTTIANEMLIEFDADDSSSGTATHTLGNSFSKNSANPVVPEETDAANLWTGVIGYRLVTAVNTYSTTMTQSGTIQGSTPYISTWSEAGGGKVAGIPGVLFRRVKVGNGISRSESAF